MKICKSEAGFSAVEALVILVIVGVISFVGYTFLNASSAQRAKGPEASQSANEKAADRSIPAAPAIEQTSDLDKASATLDQIDTDTSSDSQQLEGEASNF